MKHIFISLFLLLPLAGNAQLDPLEARLGYLPQWQFHNELEMLNWPKVMAGEELEPETLFLMTLPAVSSSRLGIYRERLESLYETLDKKGFAKKSYMAQAKMLNKLLYKDYFKQYEYLAGLDRLFDEGIFNCLTASTISALVMEHFNIPYQLKEHDNVITIEVGEGDDRIMMLDEDKLGYTPDNSLMEGIFVTFLTRFKIISEQERRLYDDKQLYNKYLMGQGDISLTELVSLHYMSQAYLANAKVELARAISLNEKAFVFFSSGERAAYWILNSKLNVFQTNDWGREGIIEDFRELANMLTIYVEDSMLHISFFSVGYASILDVLLLNSYQTEKATSYHNYLLEDLLSEEFPSKATAIFNTKMGFSHQFNHAYDKAFPFVLEAYQQDPTLSGHKLLFLDNAYSRFIDDASSREQNYETYLAATSDDSVKRELRVLYLALELQELAAQGAYTDWDRSFPVAEELYLLKPEVADYRYNYRQVVLYMLTEADEGSSCISHLLHVQDSLANLDKAGLLSPILCEAILLNVSMKFRSNQFSTALSSLNTFKEGVSERFEMPVKKMDILLSDAYWEYAAYYIRKVNYKKARAVLEEARQYLTDDGFIDEQINTVLIPLGG